MDGVENERVGENGESFSQEVEGRLISEEMRAAGALPLRERGNLIIRRLKVKRESVFLVNLPTFHAF